MTTYHQSGPATQRISHFIQFFRERRLGLSLLTRNSSLAHNASQTHEALTWRDFQQIITNARQVLPAHEFDQAAATFWQQPMNRYWIDLAQIQRRPFGLLIDLVGEYGFLFEDMPLRIVVKQHDPQRLWIHAESLNESTTNIALSYLISAEVKSFAELCGLSQFSLDVTPRPRGFDLHCVTGVTSVPLVQRIIRAMQRPPISRLMINLDSLRLSASQLRATVFQQHAQLNETQRWLMDEQEKTAELLSTLNIAHFLVHQDDSITFAEDRTPIDLFPLERFSTLAGFCRQLDDASHQDCLRLIDEARHTAFKPLKTTLVIKTDTITEITLLLYPNNQNNNITVCLISDSTSIQKPAMRRAPRSAEPAIEAITQEAMCITGPRGTIEWFNQKFISVLERSEAEVLGAPINDFIPQTLTDDRLRSFYQDRSGNERLTALPAGALIRDDAQVAICLSAQSFLDQGRQKKLYAFTDRTSAVALSLKAQDAEAHFTAQAEAIIAGQMARGAAHDLGNLLTIIQAQTDQLKASTTAQNQNTFESLKSASADAALIVKSLLPGKGSSEAPSTCDLVSLVRDIEPAMALTLGPSIRHQIEIQGQPSELFCAMAPITLKSILINLIANARDAIANAGEVTLRLLPNTRELQQETIQGSYYIIEIEDNGSGIPAAMRDRVFEPGFTTKIYRGGHGIGLSMLKQLLVEAGAEITMEQSPSGGTLVRLLIPQAKRSSVSLPSPKNQYPMHQPCALVVEPAPELQDFIALTLQSLGYRVFRASDGLSAKTIFERHGQKLDLIVCALVLPRLGSRDFVQFVLTTKPHQSGLMISSNNPSALHQQLLRDLPWENLNKPFSHAALKTAITRATTERVHWEQADQMLPRPW